MCPGFSSAVSSDIKRVEYPLLTRAGLYGERRASADKHKILTSRSKHAVNEQLVIWPSFRSVLCRALSCGIDKLQIQPMVLTTKQT